MFPSPRRQLGPRVPVPPPTWTSAAFPCSPRTQQRLAYSGWAGGLWWAGVGWGGMALKLTPTPRAWDTCWMTGEPASSWGWGTGLAGRSKVRARGCRSWEGGGLR